VERPKLRTLIYKAFFNVQSIFRQVSMPCISCRTSITCLNLSSPAVFIIMHFYNLESFFCCLLLSLLAKFRLASTIKLACTELATISPS
jgi:hypothetical protein